MFEFNVWNSPISGSHKRNIHEIFGFAVHDLFDVKGYGVMGLRDYGVIVLRGCRVKALHVLGHIWSWGYRYIEFSDFSKCFLRLGRNPDMLESNGLQIRFQREKYMEIFVLYMYKYLIWAILNHSVKIWKTFLIWFDANRLKINRTQTDSFRFNPRLQSEWIEVNQVFNQSQSEFEFIRIEPVSFFCFKNYE